MNPKTSEALEENFTKALDLTDTPIEHLKLLAATREWNGRKKKVVEVDDEDDD